MVIDFGEERISVPMERHWGTSTDGVSLHIRAAGPSDGPLVVLLHGFPEFWYGWRHQIPALAHAGYRVLIPDQRGYNRSDAPDDISAYDLDRLTADVRQIIDAEGRDRAHVIGHDWGAMVAWQLAITSPERIHRLGILNVPHPYVFSQTLRADPCQLLRSTYALFFQIPHLPEWVLGRKDGQGLALLLRWSSRSDTFTTNDMQAYRRAWRRPGRLTGMLHWYRAAARRALRTRVKDRQVPVPTLVLWGARDIALSRRMAAPSAARCLDGRLMVLDDATHWIQHDAPERVNQALLDHLDRTGTRPAS
ncbi:alpha/beta hydrolase [Salinibacter sp. 10B]|uniref:alpha/beta fold hydrolase n=1 Tax=Salinibacter sp. 10B TaxID=1923971 RepID=UPI000D261607|nr:alpha/beta hydrolase [Salinibacter sp. 10B]PQJ35630.1 alpha/beta hydrolase [Salinibacter sp. 10B]